MDEWLCSDDLWLCAQFEGFTNNIDAFYWDKFKPGVMTGPYPGSIPMESSPGAAAARIFGEQYRGRYSACEAGTMRS